MVERDPTAFRERRHAGIVVQRRGRAVKLAARDARLGEREPQRRAILRNESRVAFLGEAMLDEVELAIRDEDLQQRGRRDGMRVRRCAGIIRQALQHAPRGHTIPARQQLAHRLGPRALGERRGDEPAPAAQRETAHAVTLRGDNRSC